MAVGDLLGKNRIVSDLVPIDILEVLLLQYGEEKPRHGIVIIRRHDRGVGESRTRYGAVIGASEEAVGLNKKCTAQCAMVGDSSGLRGQSEHREVG